MAKKTIKDLRPGDTVWEFYNNSEIRENSIFSISLESIGINGVLNYKFQDGDQTSWVFEIIDRYNDKRTFYLNKIDVLKVRHTKLEKELEDTYARQQKYFETIAAKNKAIYNSNLEIINELKNQK